MLRNTFRLFSIGGIEVGIHVSWLIALALVTWSLAMGFFPGALPGIGPASAWLLGAVAALLLFASVLAHELAHSFVARSRGLGVQSITLFIFGGVSNLAGESKKASTEFLVAVVGPLTSFLVAGISYVIAALVAAPPLEALFGYLAFVNLLLGAFNLIPGFPLDGGRVLRSIIWGVSNNLRRATEIVVGIGQLVGGLLLLLGVLSALGGQLLQGLWIGAIGWFLQNAATASLQQVILETRLRGVRVGDIVRTDSAAVAPNENVSQLIDRFLLPGNRRAMPVADDGRLVGIVTIGDIAQVAAEDRERTRVADVMGGREKLATVTPRDTLSRALQALSQGDYEQVPVVEDGMLRGVLTRADVMRQLQLRELLHVGDQPA